MSTWQSVVEALVSGYFRLFKEQNNANIMIPNEIKLVIGRFFGRIIDSKILTINEFQLLSNYIKIQTTKSDWNWRLLHRATDHGFKRKDFIETCKDKINTVVIIHNNEENQDQVFGGYTPCAMTYNNKSQPADYATDESMSTFLFILRTDLNIFKDGPQIFRLKEKGSKRATSDFYRTTFQFGNGDLYLLNDDRHEKSNEVWTEKCDWLNSFEWNESKEYEDLYLCGKSEFCVCDEIEIFQLY